MVIQMSYAVLQGVDSGISGCAVEPSWIIEFSRRGFWMGPKAADGDEHKGTAELMQDTLVVFDIV